MSYDEAEKALKLFGHKFGLTGLIPITDNETKIEKEVNLQGFRGSRALIEIERSLTSFSEHIQKDNKKYDKAFNETLEQMLDAVKRCNQNYKDISKSNDAERLILLQSIIAESKNSTIIIPSGWRAQKNQNGHKGHSVSILLHNNRLFICNRGPHLGKDSGISSYTITNPENLTPEFLGRIYRREEKEFIVNTIRKELGLKEIEDEFIPKTSQNTGNCSYSNNLGGLHALNKIVLSEIISENLGSEVYKEFSKYDKQESIKSFIKTYENPKNIIPQNYLIHMMYSVIESRTEKYENNLSWQELLDMLFSKFEDIGFDTVFKSIGEVVEETTLNDFNNTAFSFMKILIKCNKIDLLKSFLSSDNALASLETEQEEEKEEERNLRNELLQMAIDNCKNNDIEILTLLINNQNFIQGVDEGLIKEAKENTGLHKPYQNAVRFR